MNEELRRRKSLTFDQAEGLADLPKQLDIGQLSNAVRAKLWDIVFLVLKAHEPRHGYTLGQPLYDVAKSHWVDISANMADEFNPDVRYVAQRWKQYFLPGAPYNKTLGFIQWFVRSYDNYGVAEAVADVLEGGHVAYRLVDRDTIMPLASMEEAETVTRALDQLQQSGKTGAREHLRAANGYLSEGKFADSIRESIHSVESFVRSETGENSLSGALKRINEQAPMHEAFKKALGNLYGYSSDEQGIRHPLLDQGDANVSERDALFMLGVCASFVTYLASYRV